MFSFVLLVAVIALHERWWRQGDSRRDLFFETDGQKKGNTFWQIFCKNRKLLELVSCQTAARVWLCLVERPNNACAQIDL